MRSVITMQRSFLVALLFIFCAGCVNKPIAEFEPSDSPIPELPEVYESSALESGYTPSAEKGITAEPQNTDDTTVTETPVPITPDTQPEYSWKPVQIYPGDDWLKEALYEKRVPPELPNPTSKTYGLEGIDAVLYNAASAFYSTKVQTPDLFLPSLAYLDSYQTDDGKTYYICWFKQCDFFLLGYGLSDLDDPKYRLSGGKFVTRFTLEESKNGEVICTELFPDFDPQGGYEKIVCGPKTELAEAIANGTELPVEERWITPSDPEELLAIYIDYYFHSPNK